jgi:hypothetical protein
MGIGLSAVRNVRIRLPTYIILGYHVSYYVCVCGGGVDLGFMLRFLVTIFNAGGVFLFLKASISTGSSSMELPVSL